MTADALPAPRISIARRIVGLAIFVATGVAVIMAWLGYRAENAAAIRGVDAKLAAVLPGLEALLPPGYHERAWAGQVAPAEYAAVVRRLSEVANQANVQYVYFCVRRDGAIYTDATSVSDDDLAKGDIGTPHDRYQQPPEALQALFDDGQARYAEYTDEYGSFRSLLKPLGPGLAMGADVQLDELRRIALGNFRSSLLIAFAVALPAALLAFARGRVIAAPIVRLARSVRAFSDDNFADDEAAIRELRFIQATSPDETGVLAAAILDLRRRLVQHLQDLERVTAEKERITAKLQIARDIQRGLLPHASPAAEHFEIAGWSEAADETGGDFYDWMTTPRGDIVFVVADVTGHGVGPSLMAAVCRAYARATLVEAAPIEPLIDRLNRLVHADAANGQFVTFFTGVLEPATRRLTVLSAAHGPILIYRAKGDRVEETPTHGLPLGVVEELSPDPGTHLTLEPGDVLLVVSDGFFEWPNAAGEQFGHERLAQALQESAGRESAAIIEHVRQAVYAFTAGTVQPDDMTAVAVRCIN